MTDNTIDPTKMAGFRYATKRAVVLNGAEAGLDTDGGPWSTLCLRHDEVVAHETRKLAGSWVHHPDEWCEACGAERKAERAAEKRAAAAAARKAAKAAK